MQHVKCPLPPLFLTEIIDRCREDHTHVCNEECQEDPGYCQRHSCDMEPVIFRIDAGYGHHEHDPTEDVDGCQWRDGEYQDVFGNLRERGELKRENHRCIRDYDDSDWIVELQYHTAGWCAVYGIKRAGDVQDIVLWMD